MRGPTGGHRPTHPNGRADDDDDLARHGASPAPDPVPVQPVVSLLWATAEQVRAHFPQLELTRCAPVDLMLAHRRQWLFGTRLWCRLVRYLNRLEWLPEEAGTITMAELLLDFELACGREFPYTGSKQTGRRGGVAGGGKKQWHYAEDYANVAGEILRSPDSVEKRVQNLGSAFHVSW